MLQVVICGHKSFLGSECLFLLALPTCYWRGGMGNRDEGTVSPLHWSCLALLKIMPLLGRWMFLLSMFGGGKWLALLGVIIFLLLEFSKSTSLIMSPCFFSPLSMLWNLQGIHKNVVTVSPTPASVLIPHPQPSTSKSRPFLSAPSVT